MIEMGEKPNSTLDTRGLFCPLPIVKTSEAIKSVPIGGVLEILATDPGVLADIPAWARKTGNQMLRTECEGNVIKLYVKKLK